MIIEVVKFRTFIGPSFLSVPVVDMKMVLSLDIYCDVTNLSKLGSLKQ